MEAQFFLFDHFAVDGLVGEYRYDDDRGAAVQGGGNGANATVYNCGAAMGHLINGFRKMVRWARALCL